MFCDRKAPIVAPDLISLLAIINHRVRSDDSIRRCLISLVCAVLEQWKVTGLHFNFNTQLQALLITQVAHKPDIYVRIHFAMDVACVRTPVGHSQDFTLQWLTELSTLQ